MGSKLELTTIDDSLNSIETGLLVVPVFKGELGDLAELGEPFRVAAEQAEADTFDAKRRKSLVLPAPDGLAAKRIALIGLGAKEKWVPADLRGVLVSASKAAAARGSSDVTVVLTHLPVESADEAVRYAAEGAVYGAYRFDRYRTKSKDDDNSELEKVALVAGDLSDDSSALRRGEAIGQAVCFARNLVSEPPSVCTPQYLVGVARDLASETGMELKAIEGLPDLEAAGMGLITAVAKGSEQPPALIHLTYRGAGFSEGSRRVALVGKGVTYDSGGYSLKPPAAQIGMHGDMAGGAAVLGAAKAVAELAPENVEVHFIVPTSENLVSGNAYKVNDIIEAKNGKTVEVVNTDAEGRLLLGDALVYAEELGVDEIVDIATLTGANVVALGALYAGIFSDDDDLSDFFMAAADVSGELFWRMPMPKRLAKKLKSQVADVKNAGGREGGSIQGALFLKNFVSKAAWLHVDMAGLGQSAEAFEHIPKGATGFGVSTLTAFVCSS